MDNQKVLFYFLIVFLLLLFITTFSNIYNSKVTEINEGFDSHSSNEDDKEVDSQLAAYVREYIDNRLKSESEAINRIRDTNNRLENISSRLDMVDESYEKADKISKSYHDFHTDYQEKLEKILEQKFDSDRNQFDIKNRVHAMRLEKIKEDLENLDELRNELDSDENDPSSPNATNRGQSLRALSDGSRLNFEHVVVNGERTDKIIISVNNGCLSFGEPSEMENGRATLSLNVNCAERYNEPFVHFEIHTINNDTEYNAKINYDNDGTKKLVSEDDNITYPFKVVSPTRHFGHCLELQDGIIKVLPCTSDIAQRFKISNSQVVGECPAETAVA